MEGWPWVALAGWLHTEISVWHQELNFFTVLHFLAFVFAPLHLYKFTITRVAYSSLSRVCLLLGCQHIQFVHSVTS